MEIVIFYLLLFFFGSAIGSFLGVIVDRSESDESFLHGRSHCDHCKHILGPADLIPLFSFLFLKGRCRYCHKKLSWYYPTIELVTGSMFVLAAHVVFGFSTLLLGDLQYYFLLVYYFALLSSFIAIFFIDMRFGIIPFKLVGFAFVTTIFWYLLLPSLYFSPADAALFGVPINILTILASAIGAGLFFFALFYFTKGRGMGFGDVVFAFLMGFVLGFPKIILALYIAFLSGAVISLLLIFTRKKKFKGGTIPFGPFLVLGTVISLLWGNVLVPVVMQFLAL